MAYRVLENIEERMILAILKIGAENGVQKVTATKIAEICDISSFTVFEHFKTKRNFLKVAAEYFDRKYITDVHEMIKSGLSIHEIWDKMLDLFMEDKDGALYYISYINTFGFDPTSNNPRAKEFLETSKEIMTIKGEVPDDHYLIAWDYLTSMAFYYAEKFIHNYMEYNEENKKFVKEIVFSGFDIML